MAHPRADDRFGPHRLIRPLGRGGFAQVWEAERTDTGRRVAVKILTELRTGSAEALERFRREGRLAASLSHPRCVYVFDAGEAEGYPYITMELMRGGTLQERLRQGPLSAATAVDFVLDVIDGLEAAQRAGIIHRDIKPSNCFLDDEGRAKVGDFGISKSLEQDSTLSQTGAFLGTPFYASPEQAAGEPLDVRSDLYSVGAMLYELLTGTPPFAGAVPSQVLAQVLTRPPTPFSEHAVSVPRGLQRVVLRLLAKQPEKRFGGYEQLRRALQPFSTHGLAPARLVRRVGAFLIDLALLWPVSAAAGMWMLRAGLRTSVLATPVVLIVQLAYFAVLERLVGGSIGKRLLALRVTTADGAPLTWGRALWRAVVFVTLYNGATLLFSLKDGLAPTGMASGGVLVLWLAVYFGCLGLLASTMRRTNAYAGLHEVASRTRVRALRARERATVVADHASPLTHATPPRTSAYGPYRSGGTVWRTASEAFVIAYDEELRRDVWIHAFTPEAAGPPVDRLHARRAGSLPWLQRSSSSEATWDVYGAPRGVGLAQWVSERGGLRWLETREILSSLVRELAARFEHQGTAGVLSLQHVWVDVSGQVVLLDFPLEPMPDDAPDGGAFEVTGENWPRFVQSVVRFAFRRPMAGWSSLPQLPLPEYARDLLIRLDGVGAPFTSIAAFLQAVAALESRPAAVQRLRRASALTLTAIPPTLTVLGLMITPLFIAQMPAWQRDLTVNLQAYVRTLQRLDSTARGSADVDPAVQRTVAAIETVIGSAHAAAERSVDAGARTLAMIPGTARPWVQRAATRYPAPSVREVAEARAWLASRVPRAEDRFHRLGVLTVLLDGWATFGILFIPAVVLGLLLRRAVLLWMFGMSLQTKEGLPAGRVRCALRAAVAWAPLGTLLVVGYSAPLPIRIMLGAAALTGAVLAIWRPERAPADWIVGTVLVPR